MRNGPAKPPRPNQVDSYSESANSSLLHVERPTNGVLKLGIQASGRVQTSDAMGSKYKASVLVVIAARLSPIKAFQLIKHNCTRVSLRC